MLWNIWYYHLKWREMLYLTISWCSDSKTRSSSACHVGPLALERVIIFAQSLCYERLLNFFWSSLNTFEQVLNKFDSDMRFVKKIHMIIFVGFVTNMRYGPKLVQMCSKLFKSYQPFQCKGSDMTSRAWSSYLTSSTRESGSSSSGSGQVSPGSPWRKDSTFSPFFENCCGP